MSQGQFEGPGEEAIREILMQAAVARASLVRRTFKPGAETSLASIIEQAAREVQSPGSFGPRSEQWSGADITDRIAEGQRAVEKLVDLMDAAAGEMPGYAPDLLGEQTLNTAWSSGFCPCWPFC